MTFLPEEDQDFLDGSGIRYELLTEDEGNAKRRGVLLPGFSLAGNLRMQQNGDLVVCETCDVLILIPDGYATTKLDSFYTTPHLKRADGSDPQAATGTPTLFGKTWQFWSRHLDGNDWRVGVDGLRTYLSYVRGELRGA
jgi:Prokaryotic E2 family E